MIRAASTFAEWEERARVPAREPVYLPERQQLRFWNLVGIGTKVIFRIVVLLSRLSHREDVMKQITALFAIVLFSSTMFAQQSKPVSVTIPEGTRIAARFADSLDSGQVRVGDPVTMDVIEDLKINGVTAIPRGAAVMGRVTAAKGARKMGRGGKLDISFETVTAWDGTKVPVRGADVAKGKGGYGAGSATGAVAAGIFFPPAGALLLLKHGHASVIEAGTLVTVQVTADTSVGAMPEPVAATPKAAAQPQCRNLVAGENNFLASDETYVPASPTHVPMACKRPN